MAYNDKVAAEKTLSNEVIHFTCGLIVSLAFYFFTKHISLTVLTFIVSVAVDADHLLDYFLHLYKTKKKFSVTTFLGGSYFDARKKIIVMLHAWEIVFILLVLYLLTQHLLFISVALGLMTHLLVDQFTNNVQNLSYFFLYRLANNFKQSAIMKQ